MRGSPLRSFSAALVVTPVGDALEMPITVVLNWTAALKN